MQITCLFAWLGRSLLESDYLLESKQNKDLTSTFGPTVSIAPQSQMETTGSKV